MTWDLFNYVILWNALKYCHCGLEYIVQKSEIKPGFRLPPEIYPHPCHEVSEVQLQTLFDSPSWPKFIINGVIFYMCILANFITIKNLMKNNLLVYGFANAIYEFVSSLFLPAIWETLEWERDPKLECRMGRVLQVPHKWALCHSIVSLIVGSSKTLKYIHNSMSCISLCFIQSNT